MPNSSHAAVVQARKMVWVTVFDAQKAHKRPPPKVNTRIQPSGLDELLIAITHQLARRHHYLEALGFPGVNNASSGAAAGSACPSAKDSPGTGIGMNTSRTGVPISGTRP